MSEPVKRYVTTCDCMSEASWGDYVRHDDYARLEQECERLRDLLRSAQWCMQVDPSCQSGVIEKCGCRKCVHSRADAALSAKP